MYDPYLSSEMLSVRAVPYASIISCLIYALLAAVCFLLFLKNPTRQARIIITVVLAILFVLLDTIILRFVSVPFIQHYAKHEIADVAAYNYLESGVGLLASLFTVPAKILLFLSLGGACGKDYRTQQV